MRLSLSLLILLPACSGCASDPPPYCDDPARAIYDTARCPHADASIDASEGGVSDAKSEPAPCTPQPRPSFVPAGWVAWDDYAPCSGFYVPTKPEELPASFTWEDCGPDTAPPITGCRKITLDPAGTNSTGLEVSLDGAGKPVVLFGQDYLDHQLFQISDADGGKVHSALMAADRARYALAPDVPTSFVYPRWLLSVANMVARTSEGLLAGDVKRIAPYVQRRWNGTVGNLPGSPGIVHMETNAIISLLDFDHPQTKLLDITTPAQNSGLGQSFPGFHGNSLFWFGNAGRVAIQRRWDQDTGPVDFINYGFDPDHGAGDLGTDGIDMVWLETHGPAIQNAFWTTADYWTSPYVKDKKDLKPRRLRSEIPNALAGDHITVGCGRAALAPSGGVRIVNLNDGSSWHIANENGKSWTWGTVFAVTCDELFLRVGTAKGTTIARVPFASLGPSSPAD